ncbi:MAG TPA: ABC transporter permease [Acidimicrobiales bacterium]|nr:ABC transporter permease [Acidimicrobiales bacterium]
MTTTVEPSAPARPTRRVTAVRVPNRTTGGEFRVIKIVFYRELIRFLNDRIRIVTALVQPFLFLFVLGSGLGALVNLGPGLSLRTFFYPGILGMSVLMTAMMAAASVVWDREYGFLREMLVAPVRRGSLVLGKCLGGAVIAGFEGVVVIAIAGLVEVPYNPLLMIEVFGIQLLLAFTICAFGMMMASRIQQMQSFMALNMLMVMPMYFLSGSMFPSRDLPTWLTVLNRADPLTYAVDPLRRLVFDHLHVSAAIRAKLDAGVSWDGWHVPTLLEVGVVGAMGLIMLSIAIFAFSRSE